MALVESARTCHHGGRCHKASHVTAWCQNAQSAMYIKTCREAKKYARLTTPPVSAGKRHMTWHGMYYARSQGCMEGLQTDLPNKKEPLIKSPHCRGRWGLTAPIVILIVDSWESGNPEPTISHHSSIAKVVDIRSHPSTIASASGEEGRSERSGWGRVQVHS